MDASQLISLYTTLFYASLALCLLGVLGAVLFFFLFDIPTVFSQLTGWGKERALRRMREQDWGSGASGSLTSGSLTSGGLTSGELNSGGAAPPSGGAEEAGSGAPRVTVILDPQNGPERETVPLRPAPRPTGRFEIFEKILEIHTEEFI